MYFKFIINYKFVIICSLPCFEFFFNRIVNQIIFRIVDKRGWFGLYNSRLIGGGIRLGQKRLKMNGENDNLNYGTGWTTDYIANTTNGTIFTPWTYSQTYVEHASFFGIYIQ